MNRTATIQPGHALSRAMAEQAAVRCHVEADPDTGGEGLTAYVFTQHDRPVAYVLAADVASAWLAAFTPRPDGTTPLPRYATDLNVILPIVLHFAGGVTLVTTDAGVRVTNATGHLAPHYEVMSHPDAPEPTRAADALARLYLEATDGLTFEPTD